MRISENKKRFAFFIEKEKSVSLFILSKHKGGLVMVVISRKELVKECKNLKLNIDSVLSQKLSEVIGELVIESEKVIDNLEAIMKQRNHFENGGFATDDHEYENDDNAQACVEAFFSKKEPVKHYIMHGANIILDKESYIGEVFAIGREETESYYMLATNEELLELPVDSYYNSVGLIVGNEVYSKLLNKDVVIEGYDFFGTYLNGAWLFYRTNKGRSFMTLMPFDLVTNLYSRNTGLLESKIMLAKKVIIAGAGSVGSLIALELARAGVGYFILADSDILEIHNVCRHQLGWKDVGRYKVDAVKDAILNINPTAKVDVFHGYLQELPSEYAENVDMIIGTGDSREANAFANDLADAVDVPFVTAGCWQRAHAGEIFYWEPKSGLPLYRKAFAQLISEDRAASHAQYFADDGDENYVNFEPGVSSDIAFVTLVAIKLIYDLLNKNEEGYTPRVLDYLKNYTLVCNTNKACIGGLNAEMFPNPLFISNNVVVNG